MDLLNSVKVFLIESLDNYCSRKKINFAILHGMIAVELLLKEKLHRINPQLIYADIDRSSLTNDNKKRPTVSLFVITKRLVNLGVQIDDKESKLIQDVAEWRNNIAHHLPVHEDSVARIKLEQIYDFICTFLVKHLNEQVKDFLPKKHITQLQKSVKELNKAIAAAKKEASKNDEVYNGFCPVCHIAGVVGIIDDENAHCYLCDIALTKEYCVVCEEQKEYYTTEDNIFGEGSLCNQCESYAEQMHIDYLIDKSRGK